MDVKTTAHAHCNLKTSRWHPAMCTTSAEFTTMCKSFRNDDNPNVEQRVQDIAQNKYMPKTALQNKLPKLNACVAVPEPIQKRITMATSLPTIIPCKTQLRQHYSEHGHTKKQHIRQTTKLVIEHRKTLFRWFGTYLLKHKCNPTPLRLNVLCISEKIRSTCQKKNTNPNQNYGRWNTMLKHSKSCNSKRTTSNRKDNGGYAIGSAPKTNIIIASLTFCSTWLKNLLKNKSKQSPESTPA